MYDAIVLAGGAARRLQGADKPQLEVGGVRLLDRVLAAVAGADRLVVVGPRRPVPVPVLWRRERPAGGGPVAAIAAALDAVRAERVVLLAADLPEIAPAVPALLGALGEPDNPGDPGAPDNSGPPNNPGTPNNSDNSGTPCDPDTFSAEVACLGGPGGRLNYLAAAWTSAALRRAVAGVGAPAGVSMRALLAGARLVEVPDPAGWGRDCDTWDELAEARRRATNQEGTA